MKRQRTSKDTSSYKKKTYRRPIKKQPMFLKAGELKWKDTSLNATLTYNTGQVFPLCTMGVGTSTQQILGDECILKSVALKLEVSVGATTTAGQVRVIVFQNLDGQADVNVLTSTAVTSLVNMSNRKKYRILLDQTQNIGQVIANSCISPKTVYFQLFKKINPNYSRCNITSGNATKNDIGVFIINSCGTANIASLGTARVRYQDS